MSADSTEITFVRCPSCRSLVPAASTRCRMCGAKLDTAAQSSEGDSSDKSRRVRQRTISDEQSDMASAVEQIRYEAADQSTLEERPEEVSGSEQDSAVQEPVNANESQPDTRTAIAEATEDEDFEDPLSDYLEDIDDEEELLNDEMEDFLAADDEVFLDEDELQGENASEPGIVKKAEEAGIKAATSAVQSPPIVPPIEAPRVSLESDDGKHKAAPVSKMLPEQEIVEQAASVSVAVESSAAEEMPAQRQETSNLSVTDNKSLIKEGVSAEIPVKKGSPKPRVVLESGSGRHKGGGLSFGKKKEVQERGSAATSAGREKQALATAKAEVEEKKEARVEGAALRKTPLKDQEEDIVKESVTIGAENKMETPDVFGRPLNLKQPQRGESVRPEEQKKGRLVGWLVNYSDSSGTSVELREGRYFVTRDSLKPADLIIDDPSISTPHALIIVGANGVMVQDLMSDRGVFNRSRDEDTYRREIDPFRTDHGDWIRFGDVEFLVSLIAHVGVK